MKKILTWTRHHARSLAFGTGAAIFSGGLLLINLDDLIQGISNREVLLNQHTSSLAAIAHDPVNLPLSLTQWLTGLLPYHGTFWLRLPSVIFALMAIAGLTYVIRRWYGPRTAFFGFFLLAASTWFLHAGRLATSDIVYVWAMVLLLVSHISLHQHSESKIAVYFWLICNLALLYVPGMAWLVAMNTVLQRNDLKEAFQTMRLWVGKLSLLLAAIILLSPLTYALAVGDTKPLGLALLGLPAAVPDIMTLLTNLRDTLLFIAIRGNAPADLWLNHLPILDAFLTTAFIAGVIFYVQHWRAGRTKLLGGLLLLSLLLVAVDGIVSIGLIVPLLYVVIAGGIAYLLHLWLVVFPRNPIARGFGIGLVSVVIAASCFYSLRQYFVAWPYHLETQQTFTPHKIEPSHR